MTTPPLHCSLLISQALLEGALEIVGAHNVRSLFVSSGLENNLDPAGTHLQYGFSWSDVAAFESAFEKTYGLAGGQGLCIRVGRASFKYLMDSFGALAGLVKPAYRLLPTLPRLQKGLEAAAVLAAKECACQVILENQETCWLWRMPSSDPVPAPLFCLSGALQELLSWASGGKFHRVHPEPGDGSAPGIRIEKKAVEI